VVIAGVYASKASGPPSQLINNVIAAKTKAAAAQKSFKVAQKQPTIGDAPSGESDSGLTEAHVRNDGSTSVRACAHFDSSPINCIPCDPARSTNDYRFISASEAPLIGISIHGCPGRDNRAPLRYEMDPSTIPPGQRVSVIFEGCNSQNPSGPLSRLETMTGGIQQAVYDQPIAG